jgi:hypothetical protein
MANVVALYGTGGKAPPERALPSVGKMAVNAGATVIRNALQLARTGRVHVPPEVEAARGGYCAVCELFRPSDGRCSKCGCFTGLGWTGKLKLAAERCPRKPPYWGAWKAPEEYAAKPSP